MYHVCLFSVLTFIESLCDLNTCSASKTEPYLSNGDQIQIFGLYGVRLQDSHVIWHIDMFYFLPTFVSLVWVVYLLTLLTPPNWMTGCQLGNVWDGAAFCVQDGEMLA
jgi:hypothetical protein